ncbi:hypothetical protein Acr_00g0041310 [Actinidia rufa]|uniref:Uncharacterized protein n=1 Tax=Actinidia rufa TaxID=165716 RepID=A0A7J0DHZ2_9ERIC|nr:hypothetical protein Acr_00g0041310 [Actinidia rufa]
MKLDLAAVIQERDASFTVIVEARDEETYVQKQLNKALGYMGELKKVAYGPVYEQDPIDDGLEKLADTTDVGNDLRMLVAAGTSVVGGDGLEDEAGGLKM